MRLENTWQEIRDHSFIQNHSRSFRFTAPWRCFFSSVHLTHFLQGSGQRTRMAIAEAWFCAQWPIYVLFLRFVFGLLYGWKIQTWPIIRFLTESVTFLSVGIWYNHDAMYLNKMSRTSSRNGPTTLKIQQYRRGLAIGSTGTFPGGLAADLARCPVLYFFCIFYLFIFIFCLPMCKSDHFRLWHSLINR